MSASINENLSGMRAKFEGEVETFTEDKLVCKNPIIQFKDWFEIARSTPEIYEPDVMILATATKNAIPSARPVLMKGYSDEGFKFYTDYDSRKGQELVENPVACLTFCWGPIHRVIRIEGTIEKNSPQDSDFRDMIFQSQNSHIDRPPSWGGYILKPHSIEFWQGQENRLHDRIRFRRPQPNDKVDNVLLHQGESGWVYERLSP